MVEHPVPAQSGRSPIALHATAARNASIVGNRTG
jgi:hypothetical protein